MTANRILLLGVGNAALALAKSVAGQCTIFGTTRNSERKAQLKGAGIEPIICPALDQLDSDLKNYADGADIFVSIPPDGRTDQAVAQYLKGARSIVYTSSTGVYGGLTGLIDEDSPVDKTSSSAQSRLQAEEIWRKIGAVILRAPGLYNLHTGLHLRLQSGSYRLPGNGSNYVSRIHLDDLAQIAVSAMKLAKPGTTYVVGDLNPTPHLEVVTWLCQRMNLPLPEEAPLSEVSPTLRGNRQIRPNRVLSDLAVNLRYPSYKEGYGAILSEINLLEGN